MSPAGAITRKQPRSDTARRLQALTEISQLITLGLDAEAILDHTTQAVARILGVQHVRAWELDETSGDLIRVSGIGDMEPGNRYELRKPAALKSVNHRVLAEGKIYQTTDVLSEPGWTNLDRVERSGLRSYLGVPLIVGDHRCGILTARFAEERIIAEEDLELIRAITAHAAIALHHARAYEETLRTEERLRTLSQISGLINSSLEPQVVLDAAAQAAARLLNVQMVSVWIYNESTQLLHLKAHEPAEQAMPRRTLRMSDSIAGWTLQLRTPYLSPRITEHPLFKRDLRKIEQPHSGLLVPFYDHDQPLGVLMALDSDNRHFVERDVELLQALADQVAAAMQNSRLYEAARQQARQLATLMHVNKHLALGPRLEETLESITEQAARLLNTEAAGLRLVVDGELQRGASYGAASALMVRETHSLREGLSGEAVRTGRPVFTTDLPNDPRVVLTNQALTLRLGFKSCLCVPLRGRSEVVGTLFVMTRQSRAFSDSDIELLEAFADQGAIAIENARLFGQQQAHARQLEVIHDLTCELTQELDLERVLDLAVTGAINLLQAKSGSLYLWKEESDLLMRVAAQGLAAAGSVPWVKLGEGVTGMAGERHSGIIENDYRNSPYALTQLLDQTSICAAAAEPILYQDRLIGVVTVATDDPHRHFSMEDSRILGIFASQAAIAIENARLFKQAARAEALDELARLKTEFLSTVSHELRTPLSLIHGYSELLVERGARLGPEQAREMAQEIHAGSRTMARLVDDLLDFSRIEQGRMELRLRNTSITDLLEEIAAAARRETGGERLVTRISPGMEGVVDAERLTQAVSNLVSNAFRFAKDGPVTLKGAVKDHELRIEVRDKGPGVPLDEQERIWEKFFRGAGAMNSPVRGSGLGMAVVKHIVELHGGEVGIISKLGHGAKFWFTIPLSE